MVEATKPKFTCSECQKSFSRAEHLTRHQALHDGSQVFSCGRCSKSFPRKDALTRHVLTHDGGPNLLERKARACRACAKSKVRCSGDRPCSRCNAKAIDCEFPEPRPQHTSTSPTMALTSPEPDTLQGSNGQQESNARSMEQHKGLPSPGTMRHPRGSVSSSNAGVSDQANNLHATEHQFDADYWNSNVLSSINWLPMASSGPTGMQALMNPIPPLQSPTFSYHPATPGGLPPINSVHGSAESPHALSSVESLGPSSSHSGEFYVDGNAGRLPRIKRQKIIPRRPSEVRSRDYGYRLFWNLSTPRDTYAERHFADFEYEAMRNAFVTLCVNCSPVMAPFISAEFPSLDAFDYLIHLFFKHLHQILPFVHRPTFNPDHEGRWILLLSMASLSCWFLQDESADDFAESLLEFLRRVTLHFDSANAWQRTFTNCRHAQIRLLLMLSASASRHESVKTWIDRCTGELCYLVNSAICRSYPKGQYENAGMPSSAEWLVWSEDEQTRRTAFLVWQIGFLRFMQTADGRPPVTLDSIALLRLPCNDAMFEAQDAETWQAIEARSPRVSLLEALEHLYIDKKLLPDLGDLSHMLLIYGVIQRTKEVQDYAQHPLSRFEPVAERRISKEMDTQPAWAASIPLYTKWRNAACDCLDVIHWQTHAAIGLAGGFEPAKVLHLHFARVLMLAPLDQLLGLAKMINIPYASSAETGRCGPEETEIRRAIQRWAISDQYKARLAAIHAGNTFWHVRRYSTNAPYEPFAVLSATLTLWALSACSSFVERSPQTADGDVRSPENCEIILIDRPTDDELVQEFVRRGQSMKALMTGVEDGLWSPAAPYKILREGTRLLATLGAWPGETERATDLLEGLAMAKI